MKRLAALSIALFFVMAIGQAQTQIANMGTKNEKQTERTAIKEILGKQLNPISMNSFSTQFGNLTDVKWLRTVNFDIAIFTNNGREMKAYYDSDGNLVGTTEYKTFNDLPAKGQKYILAKYKDYSVGPVIFYDDNTENGSEMFLYGIQFADADNYFVELAKGDLKIVVQVTPEGNVSFFKKL
jgi:hypothetical protein